MRFFPMIFSCHRKMAPDIDTGRSTRMRSTFTMNIDKIPSLFYINFKFLFAMIVSVLIYDPVCTRTHSWTGIRLPELSWLRRFSCPLLLVFIFLFDFSSNQQSKEIHAHSSLNENNRYSRMVSHEIIELLVYFHNQQWWKHSFFLIRSKEKKADFCTSEVQKYEEVPRSTL